MVSGGHRARKWSILSSESLLPIVTPIPSHKIAPQRERDRCVPVAKTVERQRVVQGATAE
jgi:hypothetical protein